METTNHVVHYRFTRNPVLVGKEGELNLQRILAGEGVQTELGYLVNWKTGEVTKRSHGPRVNWVQVDLYDLARRWVYDSKIGPRSLTRDLYERAGLQGQLIARGHVNGITWVSLPDHSGDFGFDKDLAVRIWRDFGIETTIRRLQ